MADRSESTPASLQTFQRILGDFAAVLRPWGGVLRAAAGPIYPPETEEDQDDYPFPLWVGGFVDGLTESLAHFVAELESLAEVTPETRPDYHVDLVNERAERTWREIDPGAPPQRVRGGH